MPEDTRRPLLDKIEEIKARHLGDAKKSSSGVGEVEIMYKKEALAKALASLDKKRQENMRDYRNIKERQQAAFQAMMETQARQSGKGPQPAQQPQPSGGLIPGQPSQGQPQQGPQQPQAPQGPQQGGGLL